MFCIVTTKKRVLTWLLLIVLLIPALILSSVLTKMESFAGEKSSLPIYSVETEKQIVALTINCAWGNEDIPQILELLKQEEIQATFFLVGEWCEKYPESVKAISDAGHEIGTHSDTHTAMSKLSEKEILKELNDSADKIEAVTGTRPVLFRAPSGDYDNLVIDTANANGFIPIQWSVDSIDWKNPSVDQMVSRIAAKTGRGDILLFHSGTENTAAALPEIIKDLKSKGFTFSTVSSMLYREDYTIDNTGRQRKTTKS